MITKITIAVILLAFLLSSISYSQDKKYEYSNGTYFAKIKISVKNDDLKDIPKIESMLVYQVKKNLFLLILYMEDAKGCLFDVINNSFTINLDTDTLQYQIDGNHTSPDLTAVTFDIAADDLLKYNGSKKLIANIVLLIGENDSHKNFPLKINLKPENTNVFSDFYDLSKNKNDGK